jgi:allantoate deiminase
MSPPDDIRTLARRALERCQVLAAFTEEAGRITRTFLSPPMRDVHQAVGEWMSAAGMSVRVDGLGNIVGRYPARAAGAPAVLIGSHLDTVPNAGPYDGILGVMLGIAVAEALRGTLALPVGIEVVGFS